MLKFLIRNKENCICILIFVLTSLSWANLPEHAGKVDKYPNIDPDYKNTTIPPNIAPLNFRIKNNGEAYGIEISGGKDQEKIQLKSKDGNIQIPIKSWKKLLAANKGEKIQYRVFVQESGKWTEFKSYENRVASEKIDSHLYYRLIEPQFNYWYEMGIYSRCIETFEETCVFHNKLTEHNCMNCHTFFQNSPEKMLFHMRAGEAAGTFVLQDEHLQKINTSTKFNKAGAYASWHPNGQLIAFSVNKLTQFFHGVGEIRDVMDWASDLICYHIPSNTVSTFPSIANLERSETFPAWSHDGKYLYFCSAPKLDAFTTDDDALLYRNIRYDLMRIEYNATAGKWGELETVINSEELEKSITMPRLSPDGQFLAFCAADYGNFPIFRQEADLYMLRLSDGQVSRIKANSDRADTYHSWSANSRWMVFSSKRRDGLRARPYFTYVGEDGSCSKPVLLPQKDPEFYKTFFKTYNRPELVRGALELRWQDILKTAYDNPSSIKAKLDPKVKVDRTTGATPASENMWRPVPK